MGEDAYATLRAASILDLTGRSRVVVTRDHRHAGLEALADPVSPDHEPNRPIGAHGDEIIEGLEARLQ